MTNHYLRAMLQSRPAVYLSYWFFQGMLYMDLRECLVKCSIDMLLMLVFRYILGVPFYLGFLIAHTLNMLFNGHYYALRRHMGLGENDAEQFIGHIERLKKRIETKSTLLAAAAFGSLSGNLYRPTSDIDIRFVPKNSLMAFFCVCLFALSERVRAFITGFPLDLYVFDLDDLGSKMNPKEPPIVFHDPKGLLASRYGTTVQASEFITRFKATHV
jgi:hypothetical protein